MPIHLSSETGQKFREEFETQLGQYDPGKWRIFAWQDPDYIEMNEANFSYLTIKPGMALWIISRDTSQVAFKGDLWGDGGVYEIELSPGWNLIGIPWAKTDIMLGKIAVSDGNQSFWLTSANNIFTDKCIWEYTGSGLNNGYEKLESSSQLMNAGKGYWLKVKGSNTITLKVPPDNSDGQITAQSSKSEVRSANSSSDGSYPPSPPSGTTSDKSSNSTSDSGKSTMVATGGGGGGCFIETCKGNIYESMEVRWLVMLLITGILGIIAILDILYKKYIFSNLNTM